MIQKNRPEPNLRPCGIEPHQMNSTNHSAIWTNGGSEIFEKIDEKLEISPNRLGGDLRATFTVAKPTMTNYDLLEQTLAVTMVYEFSELDR